MILFMIIFLSIIYGMELLIIWTFYRVTKTKNNFYVLFFTPAGIIAVIALILFIVNKISKKLYYFFYTLVGCLGGIGINMFLVSIIYDIISIFTDIPLSYGLTIEIGLTAIISILGIIFAQVIFVKKVNLSYPGFKGKTTICHLSDIHVGAINQKRWVSKIVSMIEENNPDVVVITGDFSDGSAKIDPEWLTPFNKLSIPILYITGNHEAYYGKKEFLEIVETTNIKYIGGETNYMFEHLGINFVGVDYEFDLRSRLSEFQPQMKTNMPNVLLFHIPLLKPKDLEEYNIFLLLAGHTHGGQIFPLQIPVYFSNACYEGLYSYLNHHIYVSSGVGFSDVPMRIGSFNKMVFITIQDDDGYIRKS